MEDEEDSSPNTNLTNVDTNVESIDEAKIWWILRGAKGHLLEFYFNHEDEFDESKDINEAIVTIVSSLTRSRNNNTNKYLDLFICYLL